MLIENVEVQADADFSTEELKYYVLCGSGKVEVSKRHDNKIGSEIGRGRQSRVDLHKTG